MFDRLSAPFPADVVHWRAQTLTKDKTKALALAYLDARDVMDRLDEVVGPEGWSDSFHETERGRVICTLSIRNNEGAWIAKSDGAGDTAVEGEKGGISDAFKRAGVKWGIGRYLYDLDKVWAPCELYDGKWSGWKQPEAGKIFAAALARVGRPSGPINDTTRDWLIAQLESAQMQPATLLDHFKPADLRELTFEQMIEAKRFIEQAKQKEAA